MTNEQSSPFSTQEALYGLLSLALIAIGTEDLLEEDYNRLDAAVHGMDTFKGLTNEKADEYLKVLLPYLDTEWEEFIFKAGNALSEDLKETVFAISCDLILREGFVPKKAEGYFEMLRQGLGIDDNLATTAVAVMQIKNRRHVLNQVPSKKKDKNGLEAANAMRLAGSYLDAINVLTPNLFQLEPSSGG